MGSHPAGRTPPHAPAGPIAAAYHDRQPGDAEAEAAADAMAEQAGFARGDVVLFTDDFLGFDAAAARIVNTLPGRQIVVETLAGRYEVVIDERQVIARGTP